MSLTIIQDDRENKPWSFNHVSDVDVIVERIETGDYTVMGYDNRFAIERKSLEDLLLSVGTERTRFRNEIRRASGKKPVNDNGNVMSGEPQPVGLDHFEVYIEEPKSALYRHAGKKKVPSAYSRMNPNAAIATIEAWEERYNVEFKWQLNRANCATKCADQLRSWVSEY